MLGANQAGKVSWIQIVALDTVTAFDTKIIGTLQTLYWTGFTLIGWGVIVGGIEET